MNEATPETVKNRRPLASRSANWAKMLAAFCIRAGVSPNAISVISIVFAIMGAYLLIRAPTVAGLLAAALCVQLRLLCNLLDGMVAIEGKRQSPTGVLYNEIPDRIGDSLFIVALGYAAGEPYIGWYGALVAAVTAYIRVLGGAVGLVQSFRGPMAKQHRMAVVTAACAVAALETGLGGPGLTLKVAAWVIAIGATLTCVTRTRAIAHQLNSR